MATVSAKRAGEEKIAPSTDVLSTLTDAVDMGSAERPVAFATLDLGDIVAQV